MQIFVEFDIFHDSTNQPMDILYEGLMTHSSPPPPPYMHNSTEPCKDVLPTYEMCAISPPEYALVVQTQLWRDQDIRAMDPRLGC